MQGLQIARNTAENVKSTTAPQHKGSSYTDPNSSLLLINSKTSNFMIEISKGY